MSDLFPTTRDFEAHKSDVDERFSNVQTQLSVLSNRIAQALDTKTIADFPDEQDQVREKVLAAFSEEFAVLLADLNKIKADIVLIKEQVGLPAS